ncbi:hypothetical protein NDI37_21965 [Funiculus sociatus GB2-A5]|uniref:Uncharacterized protein n=1 Tax=Funiculus sociatus GB2-A5 TaxID=2933946 RepID=A0ABV0JUN1_9CYAN|nr:hypothetical protein [Trichocoleus sp. FACHB-6]MBD2060763.1 hypothetical protein [Trichocoleus sp. FACHB-6]
MLLRTFDHNASRKQLLHNSRATGADYHGNAGGSGRGQTTVVVVVW